MSGAEETVGGEKAVRVEGLKLEGCSTYIGEVNAKGEPDGEGVCTWPDGTKYEGGWKDGMRHGQGVMTEKDGPRYEGEWKDGEANGRGVETGPVYVEGGVGFPVPSPPGWRYEFVGEFRSDESESDFWCGVMTLLADGRRYKCRWKDGEPEPAEAA